VTFTDANGKTVKVNVDGAQTSYVANLSGLADGKITSSLSVNTDTAGNTFTSVGGNSATLDQDSNEISTLSFVNTVAGAAGAKAVSFTVGGIDPADDTAVITFKDQSGKTTTATVTTNGTATADLSGLADGPITASMLVTDTANNTFSATSSNSAMLDQDKGEQAALKLTVNGGNPIGAAIANAVPFTVAGIEGDDNGSVSFGDGTHAPVVVNITNGALSAASANLSGFNDGTITATLHLKNDAAGNSFTDVVTTATLDQDKVAETPTLTMPSALSVLAGGFAPLGIILGADSDDTLKVVISGVPSFESITAAGVTPTITHQGRLSTYTFNALPMTDWNNGLILHSTYAGKGHPTNVLTVTVSNTTQGETSTAKAKKIKVTDPPVASNGTTLTNSELLSPSQQASLLWTNNAKLHNEMVAGLHDALVPTNNDTPLLYDSHSALFNQAMASLGTNDLSTAHDSLLLPHHPSGFHDLAASDTHTLALAPAASSADTILAVPHHG
jgi:hypothetical protein